MCRPRLCLYEEPNRASKSQWILHWPINPPLPPCCYTCWKVSRLMYRADITTLLVRSYTYYTCISASLSFSVFSSLGPVCCDRAGPLWQPLGDVLTGQVREAVCGRWCQAREEWHEWGKTANALYLIWWEVAGDEEKEPNSAWKRGHSLRSAWKENWREELFQEYWVGNTFSWLLTIKKCYYIHYCQGLMVGS